MHRILTSDDDLDNITENGIYYYHTDDVPANAPFENAAIVEVFGSNSDTTQKVQRVTRYGVSGETAERSLLSSNWLDWIHFVTNADIALMNADQLQFDSVNQNAYFKVVRDGVVYQLSADPTGIHYDKLENNVWTNIWHMYKN